MELLTRCRACGRLEKVVGTANILPPSNWVKIDNNVYCGSCVSEIREAITRGIELIQRKAK